MSQRNSIRDVAKESGLSTATISRVFNGRGTVSPKTKAKVLEACDRLGYVPNAAARALSTNKSRTIAAIIPTIEHSVFAKYVAAVEATLGEHGYSLILSISDPATDDPLNNARKLLGLGADAILLTGAQHTPEFLDFLQQRNIPFVFSSVWEATSSVPTIGYDNFALAKQAVEYLAGKGHSRIAIIHGPPRDNDRTRQRIEGAQSACAESMVIDFHEDEISVEGGKRAAGVIFKQSKNVTAVLCFADVLALGAYFGLNTLGLRVPEDISVMGFENLDWTSQAVPALTTVNLPARRMGQEVALQLINHLETGVPLKPKKIEGEIVERDSVRTI